MVRFLILTSTLLLFNQTAYAGAWTQPSGHGYAATTLTHYRSDTFFDLRGNQQPQPEFSKWEVNLYGEYGWHDALTIGANLFLHRLAQDNASGTGDATNMGIGDSELFARYRLWQGSSNVLSVQPLIKLPSYYEKDSLPQGGSDTFDADLSILFGQNFQLFGHNHYVDTRLGYRHRTDSILRDQYKADVKLAFTVHERWQLVPALSYTKSASLPSNTVFTQSGQNDYDLLKMEGTLLYTWQENTNLYTTVFAHIDGRNTGKGTGLTIGAGFNF